MTLEIIDKNKCQVCGQEIRVSIFKGYGYCGEEHRKELQRRASLNGRTQ